MTTRFALCVADSFFDSFALLLNASGPGSGTLTSTPGSLNCSSAAGAISGTCSASLPNDTSVTLTATPAAGSSFSGWSGDCANASPTCTLSVDATKRVTAHFNNGLTPQSIAFVPPPNLSVGGTSNLNATASSTLPVVFSSTTTRICTVSANAVRGVAVGTCTVAADQAGNSNFGPATQVTRSFAIGAAPLPPTNISITPGRGSAILAFSAPSGSAIARYTARCAASGQTTRTATGSGSPLTVRNLSGGALYQCTLTATDGSGSTSVESAAQPVTPAAGKNSLTPILMLLLD